MEEHTQTDASDPFLNYGKSKERKPKKKRVKTPSTSEKQKKAQKESGALRKMYSVEKQRQKKKRIEEIPHLEHVLNLLENLEGKAFLETVKEGGFLKYDKDTRLDILGYINAIIVKKRTAQGLPPFDDAISGERDNMFFRVKKELNL